MTDLDTGRHSLYYRMIDLTPPWIESPETILFHHGVGAQTDCWSGWIGALADRYRLVLFDLPGHGNSREASPRITIEDMATDVLTLADAVGCARFHLVGESIGGTVVLRVAAENAARLLSLTVSNGAHRGGAIEHLDFWQEVIDREGMSAWSDRMMKARFLDNTLEPDVWRWYQRQQASADPDTVLALMRALVDTDLSDVLPDIQVPALLLHPDSSPFIPVPVMADLHARLPDAQLRIFPNSAHGLPFSHARECSEALRQFLEEIDQA